MKSVVIWPVVLKIAISGFGVSLENCTGSLFTPCYYVVNFSVVSGSAKFTEIDPTGSCLHNVESTAAYYFSVAVFQKSFFILLLCSYRFVLVHPAINPPFRWSSRVPFTYRPWVSCYFYKSVLRPESCGYLKSPILYLVNFVTSCILPFSLISEFFTLRLLVFPTIFLSVFDSTVPSNCFVLLVTSLNRIGCDRS